MPIEKISRNAVDYKSLSSSCSSLANITSAVSYRWSMSKCILL